MRNLISYSKATRNPFEAPENSIVVVLWDGKSQWYKSFYVVLQRTRHTGHTYFKKHTSVWCLQRVLCYSYQFTSTFASRSLTSPLWKSNVNLWTGEFCWWLESVFAGVFSKVCFNPVYYIRNPVSFIRNMFNRDISIHISNVHVSECIF